VGPPNLAALIPRQNVVSDDSLLGQFCLAARTYLSYPRAMKGAEFLRKIKALGVARGIPVRLEEKRGKGSHAMLYFGNARTILQDVKRELPSGNFPRDAAPARTHARGFRGEMRRCEPSLIPRC
jgi:mRNA interferase HicA